MCCFSVTLSPHRRDEDTGAHIFQLSMVALVLTGFLFVSTGGLDSPLRIVRRLAFPAAVVVLAFAALYYLEHYFHPAHYR